MSTVLLDTHAIHWWSAEPRRMSKRASAALESADELAVAAISWLELAWLARHERIVVKIPIRSWLQGLSEQVRTIGLTPAIADTAAALPSSFPADPADRLIFATAIEHDLSLVSKDRAIRENAYPRSLVVW
ncbi:MAG TPA: type II toxin-antitoxin system VapC family toxin [Solirubrobacteraceae bacterium]|nr:type II toxin-antitoxin system VapC family toxin [Solirubrobacteraceae bacterium]